MKLKPCPFCGGKAITFKTKDNTHYPWEVACKKYYNMFRSKCGVGQMRFFETREQAITAWNTRAKVSAEKVAEILKGWTASITDTAKMDVEQYRSWRKTLAKAIAEGNITIADGTKGMRRG